MKQLIDTLNESVFDIDDESIINKKECQPKTKSELIEILQNAVKENFNRKRGSKIDLNFIDVSKIEDFERIFTYEYNNKSLAKYYDFDISDWKLDNAKTVSEMFLHCKLFDGDVSNMKMPKVKSIESMFSGCFMFTGKGLSKWDISNIENFKYAFAGCENLNLTELKNWDMSHAKNVYNMFNYASKKPDSNPMDVLQWNLTDFIGKELNSFFKP